MDNMLPKSDFVDYPLLIAVTGGLGFIGKHMVRRCLQLGHYVVNIDAVNYAADRVAEQEFNSNANYKILKQDIALLEYLPECDYIINFAAESHVDNSIANSDKFCNANILGVKRLLELTRSKHATGAPHFIQISTDEVYGDIASGSHTENSPLKPSNPYASTKAAADMLVIGWARTYRLSYNIIRMTNNYGCHQYPEKLIPKSASRMMRGKPALMHGDGSFVRSWLHAEDSVDAILRILERGVKNEIYNVHGNAELTNKQVILMIAECLGVSLDKCLIEIPNRVGQDIRYSLDDSKVRALGWYPRRNFKEELPKAVNSVSFSHFL